MLRSIHTCICVHVYVCVMTMHQRSLKLPITVKCILVDLNPRVIFHQRIKYDFNLKFEKKSN